MRSWIVTTSSTIRPHTIRTAAKLAARASAARRLTLEAVKVAMMTSAGTDDSTAANAAEPRSTPHSTRDRSVVALASTARQLTISVTASSTLRSMLGTRQQTTATPTRPNDHRTERRSTAAPITANAIAPQAAPSHMLGRGPNATMTLASGLTAAVAGTPSSAFGSAQPLARCRNSTWAASDRLL